MPEVVEVEAFDDNTIWVKFSDDVNAEIDLTPFLNVGIATALLDEAYFKQVKIDEDGGICWDNGFEFDSDFLYELAECE